MSDIQHYRFAVCLFLLGFSFRSSRNAPLSFYSLTIVSLMPYECPVLSTSSSLSLVCVFLLPLCSMRRQKVVVRLLPCVTTLFLWMFWMQPCQNLDWQLILSPLSWRLALRLLSLLSLSLSSLLVHWSSVGGKYALPLCSGSRRSQNRSVQRRCF